MSLYLRLIWLLFKSRFGPRISPWSTRRTSFRVLPNDLDVLGHMNNGRYLTVLDLARMDLMLRSGSWKLLTDEGWYPVVAGQTIAFRRSLNPWVKYDVYTRLIGVNEHGTYIEQTFCVGDEVYAQAHVRARFLKKKGGKVTEEELLALFDGAPEGLTVPAWLEAWSIENRGIPKTFHP